MSRSFCNQVQLISHSSEAEHLKSKESNPTTLHCAHLLFLLSGVTFLLIPNMGMNKHRVRDRKIFSSIVEVIEASECEERFHISDGNLSEDGQVEVNAPIAALRRISFEAAKH